MGSIELLESCVCTQSQLESPTFVSWAQRLRPAWDPAGTRPPVMLHRKLWEWLFIVQSAMGRVGLGLPLGRSHFQPSLPSLGCEITATDVASTDPAASKWIDGGQHSEQLLQLNAAGICPPDAFCNRVHFQPLNMNEIPADLSNFDFTWSACALEHLGSIRRGQDFLLNQMACLKPGGFAVHTTEFNLSSNWRTVAWNDTVLFRRQDLERVAALLQDEGHSITLNFDTGAGSADRHVDVPPFTEVHLRLLIAKCEVS